MKLNKIVALLIVALLNLAIGAVPMSTTAQNATQDITFQITGSNSLVDASFDICSTVTYGISHCNLSLSANLDLQQTVIGTFTTESDYVEPNQQVSVGGTIAPQTPTVSLAMTFGYNNQYYTANVPLLGFNQIGKSTLGGSISLGLILSFFGIQCSLCYDLNIGLQGSSSTQFVAQMAAGSFTKSSDLTWTSLAQQSSEFTLLGTSNTATVGVQTLENVGKWNVGASIGLVLGSLQIFNTTVYDQTFQSGSTNLYTWYQLDVSSAYSTTTGSGWYLSGTTAQYSVQDSSVKVNQGQREVFLGWQGAGGGATSSSLAMTAPATVMAEWQTQYSVAIEQATGGFIGANSSTWQNQGYSLALKATPNPNYQFSSWIINGQTVTGNSVYTYSVNGPSVISAAFAPIPAAQSVNANPTSNTNQFIPGVDNNVLLLSVATVVGAIIIGVTIYITRRR